jgi:hypothetical protein
MNPHINTFYSTCQQKGYVIEPTYKLLTLPCTKENAMVHININYASSKKQASDSALLSAQMLTRQNAFLQEPGYQEDIKLDTERFKDLNSKLVLSRLNKDEWSTSFALHEIRRLLFHRMNAHVLIR